ncbi:PREDICTED: uncharacterized protein LOC108972547 isoform X1 [Bactrocera latifrons]|uniref:uncharacterized protein LOC108972547 isoform X1 n=1 Tax=Bactrocera latifrons TaxID=174628 RepID=UPI0008DE659A|nr:PREDICTED: uncharacterized protein LOC108972547 isoform X1 [Bactrocera latifrons]
MCNGVWLGILTKLFYSIFYLQGTLSSRLIVTSVLSKASMLSVTSTRMQVYCSVSRHHHLGVIIKLYRLKKSSDCVKTKKFEDSEEVQSFKLLLKPIDPEMPKVIQPAGLSLERQWYIYHNLRSFVSDISKVDIVAPLPKDLPPMIRKAKTSEDVLKPDEEPGPSSSGSTRKKISRKTTTKKNS